MELSLRAYQARTRLPITGPARSGNACRAPIIAAAHAKPVYDPSRQGVCVLRPGHRCGASGFRTRRPNLESPVDRTHDGTTILAPSKRIDCSSAKIVPTKNLCFDAKQNPVSIIPKTQIVGVTELPVRLQFKIFANLVKLQIDFYRVVTASMHRDFFSANYRDGSKICASGGIDDDAINAAIPEWLTTQIKQLPSADRTDWEN